MSRIKNSIQHRSGLSVGIAAAAIILLAAVLVPVSYDQVVGYEVALAVEKPDMTLNKERLAELVKELGIHNADVRMICDTDCAIHVVDLKTEEDAALVAHAVGYMTNGAVKGEVDRVFEPHSGNIIKKLAHNEANHFVVIDRIDENGNVSGKMEHLKNLHFGDLITFERIDPETGDTIVTHLDMGDTNAFELKGENALFFSDDPNHRGGNKVIQFTPKENQYQEEQAQNGIVGSRERDSSDESLSKTVLPSGHSLSQNYPNPFNPTTTIEFSLPSAGDVRLDIYNIMGQRVKTLVDSPMSAGQHTIAWNATADDGKQLSSGIYLYRLTAGEYTISRKMNLLK